ncbi:hypothetical protein LshimejAT787_2500190 [Lyophyllum shimeji]|uniref:Uncharacterized protein n=1 Tax=Lyophyllum shimeji TaxID=47721 RepID=A0A9P3UUY9_LYOSH|nr:hypothetical protein LshimejAT787_2500190 [Lyophyllum shimeji]
MSQNLYHHYVDGSPTPETGHTAPQYQWLPSVPATLFAPPVHPGPSHSHPGPSRSHPGPTRFRFENQFQHSFSGAGSTSSASLRAALGDATGTTLNTSALMRRGNGPSHLERLDEHGNDVDKESQRFVVSGLGMPKFGSVRFSSLSPRTRTGTVDLCAGPNQNQD